MESMDRKARDGQRNLMLGICARDSLWTLSIAILLLCLGCPRSPDLADCSRIELHYRRGAIDYFIPDERILDEEEERYVRSLDTTIVSDRGLIKAFAQSVSGGTYAGKRWGETTGGVDVVGWCGDDRVISFTVYQGGLLDTDRRYYRYPMGMPDLTIFESPRIRTLKARWDCALHLSELRDAGMLRWMRRKPPYPDPNQWCDAVLGAMRELHSIDARTGQRHRAYSDSEIATMFRCPNTSATYDVNDASPYNQDTNLMDRTVRRWRSDCAMNPNCRIDSAPETVLLFEATSGWNQYGGPELFIFDNHDPRGGLVLLNDGTRQFIRTEEELMQLRWK